MHGTKRSGLAGLAAAMVAVSAGVAAGQSNSPHYPENPPGPSKSLTGRQPINTPRADVVGPTISVDFRGGTVSSFVQAVRDAANGTVNVILPPEAAKVPMAPVLLSNVSASTAMDAIEWAFAGTDEHRFDCRRISGEAEPSVTFAVQYQRQTPQNTLVLNQRASVMQRHGFIHSLRKFTEMPEGITPDPALVTDEQTVLNALNAVLQVDLNAAIEEADQQGLPKPQAPELMLHKESGVLFCRATEDQNRIIVTVLTQLREALDEKRAMARDREKSRRAAELERLTTRAEHEQASVQMKRCEDELTRATSRLKEIEEMAKVGHASGLEVQDARAAAAAARANTEQAASHLRMLEERQGVMEARWNAIGEDAALAPVSTGKIVINYDVKDLNSIMDDVYEFCKVVAPGGWSDESRPIAMGDFAPGEEPKVVVLRSWRGTGQMSMKATADQHRAIVQYLNTVRRAKSGEPNLPGLDAEALIRDAARE